jgi:hypothetical protein
MVGSAHPTEGEIAPIHLLTLNSLLGALNPEETSGTRIRNSQLSTPTYLCQSIESSKYPTIYLEPKAGSGSTSTRG